MPVGLERAFTEHGEPNSNWWRWPHSRREMGSMVLHGILAKAATTVATGAVGHIVIPPHEECEVPDSRLIRRALIRTVSIRRHRPVADPGPHRAICTAPGESPCTQTDSTVTGIVEPSTAATRPAVTIDATRSAISATSCSTALR